MVDAHGRPLQSEQKAARTAASRRKDPCRTSDLQARRGALKEWRVGDELRCEVHAYCDDQPRLRSKGSPRGRTGLLLVRAGRAERFRLCPFLWVPGLQCGQTRSGGERAQPQLPLLDAADYGPSTQLEKGV